MGVKTQPELGGDVPISLLCTSCGTEYYTDETMMNDCPECGSHYDYEVNE